MALFTNASPANIGLGANDKGSRALPTVRDPLPQHVPMIYTFAQKGTTKKVFGSGAELMANFGSETFNVDSPYHTHTSQLMSGALGAGNSCVVQRVVPTDAGPAASLVLYADIVADPALPNYVRDSLGNKVVGANNALVVDAVTPTIAGHRIKFITEVVPAGTTPGTLPTKAGTMTVGVGAAAVTSTMYPILEHHASNQGAYYSNIGYSIDPIINGKADTAAMTANKAMLYNLSLVTRTATGAAFQPMATLTGELSRQFSLKAGTKHPTTQLKLDLNTVQDTNWFNETDPLLPKVYNDYGSINVYNANLTTVLTMIMSTEAPHITTTPTVWNDGLSASTYSWFDFISTTQAGLLLEQDLINLFTAKSTKGVDYFTLVLDNTTPTLVAGQREVHISKNTPLFLEGGTDGTMDLPMLDTLVATEMAKYLDPNSNVMDTAVNVETHLYDSGFGLATKLELFNFIALRKNTNVSVGTHVFQKGGAPLPLADVRAMAVQLQNRAALTPESGYFGTPVARATIMSGAFKLYSTVDNEYYPLTFELCVKLAGLAGAGNFKWKASMNFDHGQAAVLSQGHSYQPEFIPDGVKPSLWNSGMVWAQPKDRSTYFIPGVQTVYTNDTSPLNNVLTTTALGSLNTIADDTWREFTGSSAMSDVVFKEAVLNYLNKRTEGIFDGLLTVIPDVIITPEDAIRGYSWQVVFRLYAGNMKTKMVSYTEVYRLSNLAA